MNNLTAAKGMTSEQFNPFLEVLVGGQKPESKKTKAVNKNLDPVTNDIGIIAGHYSLLFAICGQSIYDTKTKKEVKNRRLFPKSAGAAINVFLSSSVLSEKNSVDQSTVSDEVFTWGRGWKHEHESGLNTTSTNIPSMERRAADMTATKQLSFL